VGVPALKRKDEQKECSVLTTILSPGEKDSLELKKRTRKKGCLQQTKKKKKKNPTNFGTSKEDEKRERSNKKGSIEGGGEGRLSGSKEKKILE